MVAIGSSVTEMLRPSEKGPAVTLSSGDLTFDPFTVLDDFVCQLD